MDANMLNKIRYHCVGVISAAAVSKEGALVTNVIGVKGLFAIVNKSTKIPEVDATKVDVKAVANKVKSNLSSQLFSALKEEAIIEDFRASRY